MKMKIKNQLVMNAGIVVCELPSEISGYQCWAAVSAVQKDYIDRTPDGYLRINNLVRSRIPVNVMQIYTVKKVFVNSECIANNWDFGENDVKFEFFEVAYTLEQVSDILLANNIDEECLMEPWNTDYPL